MSCFPPNYNPVPPHVWFRVRNVCPTITNLDAEALQMQYKANVLKNKDNSSNYTKNQRYSKIVQGTWQNRTKSWASQSVQKNYTNPNQGLFQRTSVKQYIPVPVTENPTPCLNSSTVSPNFIPDGGYLIGNTRVNQCTGDIIQITTYPECFPTSDSDVPPTPSIKQLCFNNTNPQLTYARKRYTMNNSLNKWPMNYKFSIAPQIID
jgi:hypothetical protein